MHFSFCSTDAWGQLALPDVLAAVCEIRLPQLLMGDARDYNVAFSTTRWACPQGQERMPC
jgi:hypothetical protein